ncbi:Arylsulfatase F [Manis pentadactyla]|nr:Arylsulfatase F [Manis pentadactyla]
MEDEDGDDRGKPKVKPSTYWNQGYGYQQGYRPGCGGSDDSPHGYYGYGPGYYYSQPLNHCIMDYAQNMEQ